MRNLFPLIAALMIAGCATSTPPSTPPTPRPQLDSSLAAPCPELAKPAAADYDAWLDWARDAAKAYGECAVRHLQTVAAWPK